MSHSWSPSIRFAHGSSQQTFTLYIDNDYEDIAARRGIATDCSEEFDPTNLTVTRRCNDGHLGHYVIRFDSLDLLRSHYRSLLSLGWRTEK